jgi:sugar phosphate isomerase/epimerase
LKLGAAGILGDGSPEAARRARELGFTAVSWHVPDPEVAADRGALLRVREALEAEDLELVQVLPPQYPSLVHPDAATRARGVELVADVLRAAVVLGAGNVYVRPGSLNPAGPWTPHPENRLAQTRERLVESLRALIPHAEAAGIPLAVEAHVVSPLYSVQVVREVLDRVGSPLLGFNADPVNLIGGLEQAFNPAPLVHELFGALGDRVLCAHVKDVRVGDELVLHIEECVPGQGHMDHETFLRRFEACCPRGALLIEHLPLDRLPEARRAMLYFAHRAGLSFQEA